MNKGYRLCIKMTYGGYGLIRGFKTIEEAIFDCVKTGAVITNNSYAILDENNQEVDIKSMIDKDKYCNTKYDYLNELLQDMKAKNII